MNHRFLLLALPAFLLSGCDALSGGAAPVPEETPSETASPTPTPTATTSAQDPVGEARDVSEETDGFLFEYSYPQAAAEEPGLAAWLDRRMDRERAHLESEAEDGRELARANGFPFNKYSSGTAWEVVADLPGYLSLSAALSIYYGGAHPNYGFDSIVWDRGNEQALESLSLFRSSSALEEALGEQLCEMLNAERSERRGNPVDANSSEIFERCVAIEDTTLLLGSSNGRAFNRIGIQISPYVAGPYAEGSYEFTIPVDAEILAAVKPQYRAAFAIME